MTLQNVPLDKVFAGDNDRKEFDPRELQALADSIARDGLNQPPVYRLMMDGTYQIVAGERRTRACKLLGWATIPAFVRELTDAQASAIMLSENTARINLNPVEEAHAYAKRMNEGLDIEEVASMAGVSDDLIKRRLRLLTLRDDIQHLVSNSHFPLAHAELISDLDNNRQMIAFQTFLNADGMPFRTFKQFVVQLKEEQNQEALFDLSELWVQQVTQETAKLDRRKKTHVPRNDALPLPAVERKDKTITAMMRLLDLWEKEGLVEQAETLGTAIDFLVQKNFLKLD